MKTPAFFRWRTLFAVMALSASPVLAQMPSPKTYLSNGGIGQYGGNAALDLSHNLILSFMAGYNSATVRAVSPLNAILWTKTGPGMPGGIVVDGAGNIYITGHEYEPEKNFAIWKLDPSGNPLWTCTDPAAVIGHGDMIVLDDQGGVYAAGYAAGSSTDLYLMKCDVAGNFQWSRKFSGSAGLEDKASGLVEMPGGGVVVTGITRNSNEQIVTIRYSAAGAGQWISYYDAPNMTEGPPCGVVRTDDGALAVAGMSGMRDLATVKYSEAGQELWVNRTDITTAPTEMGYACKVVPRQGGGVAVLDYIKAPSGGTASRLLAIGGDGVTSWHTTVNSIPFMSQYMDAESMALAVLPGGSFVVASGISNVSGSSSVGNWGRVHSVPPAGGSAILEQTWSEPTFDPPRSCRNILVGKDGSVWAVTRDSAVRWGAVRAPGPPGLGNVGFDSLQPASVRFKGTVDPNGQATQYHYEYGLTASYGSSTPVRNIPSGWTPVETFEPGVTVTAGVEWHFSLVATNSSGTTRSADQYFTVPQSDYQVWIVNAFGSLQAPSGGPQDDADGDGVSNLVEYAFGGEATVPGVPAGLPVFSMWVSEDSGITFPSIVYRPDATRTGVTVAPEASNDLTTWTTSGITVTNLPDGSLRAVAQGLHQWLRVRVNSP